MRSMKNQISKNQLKGLKKIQVKKLNCQLTKTEMSKYLAEELESRIHISAYRNLFQWSERQALLFRRALPRLKNMQNMHQFVQINIFHDWDVGK